MGVGTFKFVCSEHPACKDFLLLNVCLASCVTLVFSVSVSDLLASHQMPVAVAIPCGSEFQSLFAVPAGYLLPAMISG